MRKLNSTSCQNKQHPTHRCCWRCLCNLTQQFDILANYWHAPIISIPFRFDSIQLIYEEKKDSVKSVNRFQRVSITSYFLRHTQWPSVKSLLTAASHLKYAKMCARLQPTLRKRWNFSESNNQLSHSWICPQRIGYKTYRFRVIISNKNIQIRSY